MTTLINTINANDLTLWTPNTSIVSFLVYVVDKRLYMSLTDALVDRSNVNPEEAYEIG